MNRLKTLAGSAAIVAIATSAQAGGMADEIMEAPVVVEEEMMAPAASSVSPTLIVVGILAALLLAASSSGEDEGNTDSISVSDMQLKENITEVGSTFSGLPIYTFNYIGQDGLYLGVMAQDVLMHTPEAAIMMGNGYYAVDYGLLGLSMKKLN